MRHAFVLALALSIQAAPITLRIRVFDGSNEVTAETRINVFKAGGETFVNLLVNIVPLLIILLTAVNALVRMIARTPLSLLAC